MSTLSFLPWLSLEETVETPAFRLLPYRRGSKPSGKNSVPQSECDSILELYRLSPVAAVRSATILQVSGFEVTQQLDDEMIQRVLRWGELVAFSGLSARSFFDGMSYASRETFRLIIQNYDDPTSGFSVTSRRRDGSSTMIVSRSAASFMQPLHSHSETRTGVDGDLLRSLLARSDQPEWGTYQEAIAGFNIANTDSTDILPEIEAVNIVGAFERLFDLSRGREDELATQFSASLEPKISIAPDASRRVSASKAPAKYLKRETMREVWIRDLFQLRGEHAHGKMEARLSTLWTLREHLLLASFAFPLAVKQRLAKEGFYTMSDADLVHIEAFESLLEPEHFAERKAHETGAFPWTRIIGRMQTRLLAERFVSQMSVDWP